jgi:hypothetical protein
MTAHEFWNLVLLDIPNEIDVRLSFSQIALTT